MIPLYFMFCMLIGGEVNCHEYGPFWTQTQCDNVANAMTRLGGGSASTCYQIGR